MIPAAECWAAQKVLVRFGGYVPIGAGPDARLIQRLTITDVLENSPAFTAATTSFGLRSEYGSSLWGLFVQAGVDF